MARNLFAPTCGRRVSSWRCMYEAVRLMEMGHLNYARLTGEGTLKRRVSQVTYGLRSPSV